MYQLLIQITDSNPHRDIVSIEKVKPEKIIFLTTEQTEKNVNIIIEKLKEKNVLINPAQYEVLCLDNPLDFSFCIQKLRSELDYRVDSWLHRGNEFKILVDFSSGPKPMSGALVLIAHRWECSFIYVGKEDGNEPEDVYSFENVLDYPNPWDELGLQAREETIMMFNRHYYNVASEILERARNKVSRSSSKQEINTLKNLVDGYAAWDRFDHEQALHFLKQATKNISSFSYLFSHNIMHELENQMLANIKFLNQLLSHKNINLFLVYDLIANAERRASDARYDDAIARLYRTIEAIAQIKMNEIFEIDEKGYIVLDSVTKEQKEKLHKIKNIEKVQCNLQNSYFILSELDIPLGKRFYELKLHEVNSPLSGRNSSILAHGFTPVSKKLWDRLHPTVFRLGDINSSKIPKFPQIDWT